MTHFVIVIEDHMLDWHLCQICYPVNIFNFPIQSQMTHFVIVIEDHMLD